MIGLFVVFCLSLGAATGFLVRTWPHDMKWAAIFATTAMLACIGIMLKILGVL